MRICTSVSPSHELADVERQDGHARAATEFQVRSRDNSCRALPHTALGCSVGVVERSHTALGRSVARRGESAQLRALSPPTNSGTFGLLASFVLTIILLLTGPAIASPTRLEPDH
jgi:hypothetical protein